MAISEYVILIAIGFGEVVSGGIASIDIRNFEVVLFDEILHKLVELGG
jgi:hypothetical protein